MMMMRKPNPFHVLAVAAALTAAGAGCEADGKKTVPVEESADLVEHNRLMVRMAFAENVYNGTASERAVYAKDFHAGTSALNALGRRRVATLVDICQDATGSVTVVRGDEPDALFAARVDAVRQELTGAGVDPEGISVSGGLVGGVPVSSDRAILSFNRMLADYAPGAQRGASSGSPAAGPSGATGGSNTNQQRR